MTTYNIIINDMAGTDKQRAYAADLLTKAMEEAARESLRGLSSILVGYINRNGIEIDKPAFGQWLLNNLAKADKSGLELAKLYALLDGYTKRHTCREVIDGKYELKAAVIVESYIAA